MTRNPAGASATESPCDIHTLTSLGTSEKSVPGVVTRSGVPPNSLSPVRATVPPSAWAIAWNP